MIIFSFTTVILILLSILAVCVAVWYSQRDLQLKDRISLVANVATVATILLSVMALALSLGLQLRNEKATRVANEEAAHYAQEQRKLLEQSVTALNQSATLLKEQAKASKSAASYLERQYAIQSSQRQEELQRRAMIPDIRPALELIAEDGSASELAVLSRTTWSNYGSPFEIRIKPSSDSVKFEMNLRVINQGRATLRDGNVSLRTGFQPDIRLGFSNHPPSYMDRLDVPLKNLRPMKQASSFYTNRIFVLVPKPQTGSERLFNLYLHFEGDQAERRDANIWFKVYFEVGP